MTLSKRTIIGIITGVVFITVALALGLIPVYTRGSPKAAIALVTVQINTMETVVSTMVTDLVGLNMETTIKTITTTVRSSQATGTTKTTTSTIATASTQTNTVTTTASTRASTTKTNTVITATTATVGAT